MRLLLEFFLFFVSTFVFSSLPLEVSLEKLVENSDHLLVGHVVGVEMMDDKGNALVDLEAMTGPEIGNTIRLIVEIDEVILSNVRKVPSVIKVPLDPFMHYSLGQIKEAHDKDNPKFLLLLKGSDFNPPFPGVFGRSIEDKDEILSLLKSNQAQKKDPDEQGTS